MISQRQVHVSFTHGVPTRDCPTRKLRADRVGGRTKRFAVATGEAKSSDVAALRAAV
jgi:hypothetical protein